MENKKLIAEALLEIAKRSETTFLEVGKEDKELIEAAKKIGIELPSPDLMVMKTVYAEIDKVNLNGVILPRKAVKEGLNTLIGKQCNWEHNGSGYVCGYTISAKINEDKVETINVLFKSLFPEQADELKEKVKSGEAAVSFEIWNISPDTKKSVVTDLDNGYKEISPIIFHGTGVLLSHKPACPKAKIFKLIAKNEINESEKIIDKVFNQDLVYAQMAIEEPKCLNCQNCKCKTEKEDKKLEEIKVEEAKKKDGDECDMGDGKKGEMHIDKDGKMSCIMPDAHKKMHEEMKKAEIIPEIKVEETTVVPEVKLEEVAKTTPQETVVTPEVKPEVVAEVPAAVVAEEVKAQEVETIVPKVIVKVTRIYSEVSIDTYVDGTSSGTYESKGYKKNITEYSDGTKDETESDVKIEKKFSFSELEEKVNAAKAEKDSEIAKLKQELESKSQEIVKAKVEEASLPDLTVGEVITSAKDETLEREKKAVNDFIARKHKK